MVTCTYEPGRVQCRTMNIGPVPLSGEGALIKFVFNVSQTRTGAANVNIEYPRFGSRTVTVVPGVFTVAPLSITLTPQNPPIQISAGGGYFDFNAQLDNASQNPMTIDAWTDVTLPNGTTLGRALIMRSNLPLSAKATLYREGIRQQVPSSAPPGNYIYIGNVGYYPDSVIAFDTFPFTKLAGESTGGEDMGWTITGWFDDDEFSVLNSQFLILNFSPNPFNASTALSFELQAASNVRLAIYDIAGREIAVLVDGFKPAGTHQVVLDASAISSGVYFARLTAGGTSQTVKMLLVK